MATGLSFVVFGIGGVLIGLIGYPLLLLTTRQHNRVKYGQLLVHYNFAFFAWFMKILGIYSIEIHHRERLKQQGMLIIANHPTLIDVVLLLSLLRQSDCVVKSKLTQNVATKGPLLAAGYIENNSPEQLLESCVVGLKDQRNLLIFPEGTRTRNLNRLSFKRGASLIALKSGRPIVPITIKCIPRMLAKGQKWYKIPHSKPHFTIKIGDPIVFDDLLYSGEALSIQSRKLNRRLIKYYSEELQLGKNNN
ncbi:MAG: lysophospholipid acyltransferase family protein [Marinicella sp.]|nr:1-acyl-sn-glycerol-3-phosphate acyltransferase [Xanthomonadales bacterium]